MRQPLTLTLVLMFHQRSMSCPHDKISDIQCSLRSLPNRPPLKILEVSDNGIQWTGGTISNDTTILPISSPHSAVSSKTLWTTYLGPHGLCVDPSQRKGGCSYPSIRQRSSVSRRKVSKQKWYLILWMVETSCTTLDGWNWLKHVETLLIIINYGIHQSGEVSVFFRTLSFQDFKEAHQRLQERTPCGRIHGNHPVVNRKVEHIK